MDTKRMIVRGLPPATTGSAGLSRLRQQLLSEALADARGLASQVQAATLLILINEPSFVRSWWLQWRPEFSALLIKLSMLEEITDATVPLGVREPTPWNRLLAEGCARCQEIERLVGRGEGLAVSNALERGLQPWLADLPAALRPAL